MCLTNAPFLSLLECSPRRRRLVRRMNILAPRVGQAISLIHSLFDSYGGVRRLPVVNFSNRKRDLSGCCVRGMAQSLEKDRGYIESDAKMDITNCNGFIKNNEEMGLVCSANEEYAEEAIEAIKAGKVIAVPTDTLYGFACDACSAEAVNRIYEIKGRKHTSPLAICVGDVEDITRFAVTDHLPNGLLHSLLPGPVTVILMRGKSSILDKSLNPGLDSIGVRVPDSNFIRAIARGSGSALALTSANLSGQPSSVDIRDFENLWEQCVYIYDGGVLPSGRAGSTIVDLSKIGSYKILRPGSAKEETISILKKYSLLDDGSGA